MKLWNGTAWVDTSYSVAADEVFVGPAEPPTTYELWVDSDDPGSYMKPPIFATAAARDAAWPAATAGNGAWCITLDTNRQWQVIGGAWTLVGGSMPRVLATKTAVQSLAASWNVLTWPSESYDTDGMHDNVTNNSRLTIPAGLGGLWTVFYTFYGDGSSAGRLVAQIAKNNLITTWIAGSSASYVGTDDGQRGGSADLLLVPGDYLEVHCYSAVVRNAGAAGFTATFGATYRGPA